MLRQFTTPGGRIGTLLCLVLIVGSTGCQSVEPGTPGAMKSGAFWGAWPAKTDPRDAGRKMAVNLVGREVYDGRNYGLTYLEVCAGYGALRFTSTVNDKQLLAKLVDRYDGMLLATQPATQPNAAPVVMPEPAPSPNATAAEPPTTQGRGRGRRGGAGGGGAGGRGGGGNAIRFIPVATAYAGNMIPTADHVDRSVFGVLALEMYKQTQNPQYLAIGKKSADEQWANPQPDGLTSQTRWWIDDMFMITGLQMQAYRTTKDKAYLDRSALEMAAYLDKLQKPNGLFFHETEVPFYWGRGVGWCAVGLAELLSELPEDHPKRARILEGYRKLMDGLLKCQAESGMWRQLIDRPESWEETSGTGMIIYSMARGVRKGWLPEPEYKQAARKAWIALAGYQNDDGAVREVCIGTNRTNDYQFYMNRPRAVGDLHGQAAFSWAAWAMLD